MAKKKKKSRKRDETWNSCFWNHKMKWNESESWFTILYSVMLKCELTQPLLYGQFGPKIFEFSAKKLAFQILLSFRKNLVFFVKVEFLEPILAKNFLKVLMPFTDIKSRQKRHVKWVDFSLHHPSSFWRQNYMEL